MQHEDVPPPEEQEIPATEAAQPEEDYRQKYLMLLAEMENTRKRLQKEKEETIRFAAENMAADFLPPIDNLEQALQFADQMSPEIRNWALGFKMILSQLLEALAGHGITAFTSVGMPFDPHLHEAVEMEASTEHPPGTVLRELIRGYKSKEHTVRAARVVVAKAPSETDK